MNRAQAIQEYNKTVATLLADLDQLGVKYKATDRHENNHTNIKVTRKKKYCFRDLNITNRILESKPGDVLEFPAGSYPLVNLQSTITSKANKILGPGRYRTEQDATNNCVRLHVHGSTAHSGIAQIMQALQGPLQ